MCSFCNNFSSIFFKTIIIRFNLIVLSILNKLALIIVKRTRTRILIKIIISIKKIIIQKIRTIILKSLKRKINSITRLKSSFFKFRNHD